MARLGVLPDYLDFDASVLRAGTAHRHTEDVGVSSVKVQELSTFMQSLVDQGKIAAA